MRKAVIVGLGLIGGSIAQALRGFEDFKVVGADKSPEVRSRALERGLIDEISENTEDAIASADVVYLCMVCKVTEDIDNIAGTGAVTVDGKIWTARSRDGETIAKDALVKPVAIQGVRLIVVPADTEVPADGN